jgi:hypothetical protein
MAYGVGPNLVRDGLVLYLDAANPKSYPGSGTQWSDLTGSGNNGTLVNGVGYTSDNGGAMVFDGVNDYISVGNVGANTTKTVVCWFSMSNVNTNMSLFGFGTQQSNTQNVYMWGGDNNGAFGFNNWNSDSWGYSGGENEIKNLGFFQVVAEFNFLDYTKHKLWINGQGKSISNVRGTNIQRTQSNNFGIGYNGWNTSNQIWNGNISLIKVYDRILTTQEIQQNFNATRGRFGL